MEIVRLIDHPQLIPEVTNHLWGEWSRLEQAWGVKTKEELALNLTSQGQKSLPITFVGLIGGELVGTVSAVEDDMKGLAHSYAPWLSTLYVVPSHRRKGIATELLAYGKKYLRDLGYTEAYLWAEKPQWEAVYTQLGWSTVERVKYLWYTPPIMSATLEGRSSQSQDHTEQ